MQCTPLSDSETGPITTRLPSATDRKRQGEVLAAAGRRSSEHPEALARICSTSTPTEKEERKRRRERNHGGGKGEKTFGQLALMLPPAQICLSCDESTACWIFPQISHAVG